MSKFIQALLSGVFFTFILDFFLFLGVKLHYIDRYEIDEYYNLLFADHQNLLIFAIVSVFIGFVTLYSNIKIALGIVGSLFVLVFLTLIPAFGEKTGEFLLMQKGVTLQTKRFTYHGDILYVGRKETTFFDHELQKIVTLSNKKIVGVQP